MPKLNQWWNQLLNHEPVDVLPSRRIFHNQNQLIFAQQESDQEVKVMGQLGDTNFDGRVTFSDFLVLSANFGRLTNGGYSVGDFDEDGNVDFADFLLLSSSFEEN